MNYIRIKMPGIRIGNFADFFLSIGKGGKGYESKIISNAY